MDVQETLSIPESIYRQALYDARQQARRVEELLAESLNQHYGFSSDDEYQALMRESETFEAQHDLLKTLYGGLYIAMLDGKVIDQSEDRVALSDRVYAAHPNQTVLIRRVTQEPERTLHFRSPRLIRDA